MNTVKPETVGLSGRELDKVMSHLRRLVDRRQIPFATMLVARNGELAYTGHTGWADIENEVPASDETIVRIASMTKPIVSAAVLMLQEDALIKLTDPVWWNLPQLRELKVAVPKKDGGYRLAKLERDITIRDLLTHTSGLSYDFPEIPELNDKYADVMSFKQRDWTLNDWLNAVAELPIPQQPGKSFRYSVSDDVLGCLIEAVADKPLDVFLKERIFGPLEMNDTGFDLPESKWPRIAKVYGRPKDGKLQGPLTDTELAMVPWPTTLQSGGGGLFSTGHDYLKFARMLLNKGELKGNRLLGRKTVEMMTMNHLPAHQVPIFMGPNPQHGYGFGLGVRVMVDVAQSCYPGTVGEYGWAGAQTTYFFNDPAEDLIGILLSQLMPSDDRLGHQSRAMICQCIE